MITKIDSSSSSLYGDMLQEPVYEVPGEPVYEVPINTRWYVPGDTLRHGSIGAVHHNCLSSLPHFRSTMTKTLENDRVFVSRLEAGIDVASRKKWFRKPFRSVTAGWAGIWLDCEKYTCLVESKQRALEDKHLHQEAFTESLRPHGPGMPIRYKSKNLAAAAKLVQKAYIKVRKTKIM